MHISPAAALTLALCLGAPNALAGVIGSGTITLIADGASNTIQFTPLSRLSTCLDNVLGAAPLDSISDGSSNTLLFGPSLYLTLQVGTSLVYQPLSNIRDGSSNTVFLGESAPDERCFAGDTGIVDVGNAVVDGSSNTIEFAELSRFDVCFRNVSVGSLVDGSSNTLFFGEPQGGPVCFEDVRVGAVAATPSAVPEPGTLALLAAAWAALVFTRWNAIAGSGAAY